MSAALRRPIAASFVAAPPAGARVRPRLLVDPTDAQVLFGIGQHLGSLASKDLKVRCSGGARAESRRERNRALTAHASGCDFRRVTPPRGGRAITETDRTGSRPSGAGHGEDSSRGKVIAS